MTLFNFSPRAKYEAVMFEVQNLELKSLFLQREIAKKRNEAMQAWQARSN